MPGLQSRSTDSDVKSAESDMERELQRRARSDLKGVNSNNEVHIRDILPSEDLQSGDGNGWNGNDRAWKQVDLGPGENETYVINSGERMEGKVVGIFAISHQGDGSPATTEITFEDGTGSTFERLMFEEYNTFEEGEYAMLRNPVVIDEGKDAHIYQYTDLADEATADDNLVFHGLIAEKAGTTLGTRSRGESAPTGTARRPQGGR